MTTPSNISASGVLAGGDAIDRERLRAGRLTRFQAAMHETGLAACLLCHPANIRYTTGTSMLDVFCASTTARYCIVPAAGEPVLFEWVLGVPISAKSVKDVRVATWWPFTGSRRDGRADEFAGGVLSVLHELGLEHEELGVDRLDAIGFLALQRAGMRLVDASPVCDAARETKTAEEIQLLRLNGAIGDAMMSEFEAAIRPGIREYELFAVLSDSLLRRHGEVVFSRLIASGQNTNPWGSEAHAKVVREGDIVAVDTDALGYEGYLIDISRTFICGDGDATSAQIELYRIAHDFLAAMRESLRTGLSYDEYARIVTPAFPEKYRAQRYDLMVHGAGLEDEGPIIYFSDQGDNPRDEYLHENMALCLECYVGDVGGSFGVKLEDQVLLTASGAERLCTYPFDDRLLHR